ncbi:MAG TPA: YggS family pyridoxal phosphate-dependent enzyme [Roseiflexaceae bacterium]|nr:YggS family pyridoxal phosphate-dependent enzyme [Roseiflexaceae bacterium]
MDSIATRIEAVRERIAAAARRAGRSPEQVRLVGVSKTHPAELVAQALAAGLHDFGENRVQEAEPKIAALAADRGAITWHLIGHLQSNKARRAAALFDVIHSVDSLHLAEALTRGVRGWELGVAGKSPNPQLPTPNSLPILLQVNVSGEASKDGFALAGWEQRPQVRDAFFEQVERLLALPALRVDGLMTIAPWGEDPEAARSTFRSARQLRDALAQRFPVADWSALSMGMTDDFEVAIEEGATIVRVGRAIFGARQ